MHIIHIAGSSMICIVSTDETTANQLWSSRSGAAACRAIRRSQRIEAPVTHVNLSVFFMLSSTARSSDSSSFRPVGMNGAEVQPENPNSLPARTISTNARFALIGKCHW